MFEFNEGASLTHNPLRPRPRQAEITVVPVAIRGPRARRFAFLHYLMHVGVDFLERYLFRSQAPAALLRTRFESGDQSIENDSRWLEVGDGCRLVMRAREGG
jgi:hypothetical protein